MSDLNRENLFSAFSSTTDEEWKALIKSELQKKGAVIDHAPAGLEGVQPYYSSADFRKEFHPGPIPKNSRNDNDWLIREDRKVQNTEKANKQLLHSLESGINSLGLEVSEAIRPGILLKNIYADAIHINWKTSADPVQLLEDFAQWVEGQGYAPSSIRGALEFDPIGELLLSGQWQSSREDDLKTALAAFSLTERKLSAYHALSVEGLLYQAAGASCVQQIGSTLAHINEYLALAAENQLDVARMAEKLMIRMGIGSGYFPEIAKFRAFRLLWTQLLEGYGISEGPSAFIHAETSSWNMTIYDPYVNLLRSTTAAMSAVLGGCDSLRLLPFDYAYKTPSPFSMRLARNIQHLAREEAYLQKSIDPAAGSYYLEIMTDRMAKEAWAFFQKIEADGGLIESLKKGKLQKEIEQTAAEKMESIRQGSTPVLGVNKHPNAQEKMKDKIDAVVPPGTEQKTGSKAIQPLTPLRATAEVEQKRLDSE